jgi:N-acetylglutamate synthase/N-acetylornithine aminotransferase
LREITVRILKDGGRTPLYCRVEEALSKQAARRIAKNLVGKAGVKDLLQSMETLKETLLFALWEEEDISSANVYLKTNGESIVFMQDGVPLPCGEEGLKKLLNGEEYELVVRLSKGNFSATAFGTLKK